MLSSFSFNCHPRIFTYSLTIVGYGVPQSLGEKHLITGVPLFSFSWFQWHLLSVSKQPALHCVCSWWTLNRLEGRTMASTEMPRYCDRTRQRGSHTWLFTVLNLSSYYVTHSVHIVSYWVSLRSSSWHKCWERRRQRKERRQWIFNLVDHFETWNHHHQNCAFS